MTTEKAKDMIQTISNNVRMFARRASMKANTSFWTSSQNLRNRTTNNNSGNVAMITTLVILILDYPIPPFKKKKMKKRTMEKKRTIRRGSKTMLILITVKTTRPTIAGTMGTRKSCQRSMKLLLTKKAMNNACTMGTRCWRSTMRRVGCRWCPKFWICLMSTTRNTRSWSYRITRIGRTWSECCKADTNLRITASTMNRWISYRSNRSPKPSRKRWRGSAVMTMKQNAKEWNGSARRNRGTRKIWKKSWKAKACATWCGRIPIRSKQFRDAQMFHFVFDLGRVPLLAIRIMDVRLLDQQLRYIATVQPV